MIYAWIKQQASRERLHVFLLILLSLLLFFYRLGAPALWDESEAMYTEVARQLVVTGNWVVLHFNGHPWFVHPPLFMWLTALISMVAGWSQWTPRLVSALFTTGAVLATYQFGKSAYGKTVGLLSAIIFCTAFQVIIGARIGVMDSALMFFILVSLIGYYHLLISGKPVSYFVFFVSAGFGTLTKGPIALILPLLIILPHIFFTGSIKKLNVKLILAGTAIYAVISASWYLAVFASQGNIFLRYALGYHSFGRFFGSVESQTGPWYYYLIVIFLGFFPWTGFIPSMIESALDANSRLQGYLFLSWIAVAVIFYSCAGTKLPDYINVIYPAMAILTAAAFVRSRSSADANVLRLSAILSVIISVMMMAAGAYFIKSSLPAQYMQSTYVFMPLGLIVSVEVILSIYLIKTKRYILLPVILTVMMAFFISYTVAGILPEIEKYRPVKELSLELGKEAGPGDLIGVYNMQRIASIAFYSRRHIEWLNTEKELAAFLKSPGKRHYLLISHDDKDLPMLSGKVLTLRENNGISIIMFRGLF